LGQLTPTLVITDLAMPGVDGWGVLAAVRGNLASAHVPVVAVTSYHSNKLADEAITRGFDAYFPKPLNPDSFVQELDALITG
jgi:CheY-like chemotaxis protein